MAGSVNNSRLKSITYPNGRVLRYEYDGQSQKSITSITHSGATATVTLSGHGYGNGDLVEITGASNPLYNGRFVISNVTSTTFDYTMAGTPASNASGTLKAKKVSVNDEISRVSYLADDSSGSVGTHLEEYSYLGLGTIVQRNRPEPGTKLTYITQTASTADAGDQYTGLDRFGRVADQDWTDTAGTTDIDRFQYGYDRDSNVLYKDNTLSSSNSELYHASSTASGDDNSAYDGLNRLIDFARGTLSSSSNNGASLDEISGAATDGQSWGLDQLGNSNDFTSWVGLTSTIDPGTAQTTTSGWYGEKITVGSSDLTITQLGRMYVSGNTGTHTVKIVDASNGSDVSGGSVSIATSGGQAGVIQYANLSTPVTLTHGHDYYIVSQESSSGDQWYDNTTVLTTTSAATVDGAASNTGSWTVGGTANRSWGPVDFKYILAQSNSFNAQNEATGFGASTLTYDHNGNTTTDETGKQFVYDAWNHLHQVKDTVGNSSASLETYTYDAIGRRLTEAVVGGNTTHLYYSSQWQVLEERLGSSSNASIQNVWGLGFVNDLVLRDRDADANSGTGSLGKSSSGLEERLYVDQDANYNVTSLTNTSGVVQERYLYTPYGVVTFLDGSWGVLGSSAKGMAYLYQGGRRDTISGFYNFQQRDDDPDLQRWMEQDLKGGYIDGNNLYQFERSNAIIWNDPEGRQVIFDVDPGDDCAWAERVRQFWNEAKNRASADVRRVLDDIENDNFTCKIHVVSQIYEVRWGSYILGAIDVDDFERTPIKGGGLTRDSVLIHEVVEQWEKQKNHKVYQTAHKEGIRVEEMVSGNKRDIDITESPLPDGGFVYAGTFKHTITVTKDGKKTEQDIYIAHVAVFDKEGIRIKVTEQQIK